MAVVVDLLGRVGMAVLYGLYGGLVGCVVAWLFVVVSLAHGA